MKRIAALALAAAAAGFSPFRAEQPDVRAGNERLAAGQPQDALPRYDAAERAVGPRAQIDYDRGVALYRLGKLDEARDAFRRALERGAGDLSSRANQNLGNALAAAGDRDGAIAAYREALRRDPRNEDARFDLEVLLRRKRQEDSQQKQQQKQGGQPKAAPSAPDDAQDKAQDGAQRPPQPRSQPGGAPPPAQAGREGETPRPAEPAPGERREPAPDRLSEDEAARILDAFRAREKAMPLGGDERRRAWRRDADRDW